MIVPGPKLWPRVLGEGEAGRGIRGIAFDNRADLGQLLAIKPWLVIDASGPFQGSDFELAKAALESGAHWIDLADARDYVLGFAEALDPLARRNNVVALTGASSTPALSSAVVESLTVGWRRINSVESAIAPGGASDVGLSVIEAILSYAGRPVPIFSGGRLQTTIGWGSAERWNFPGLGFRFVSPVETPDTELLPKYLGIGERVRFFAGLESRLEHFGLLALARVFGGKCRSSLLAKTLHRARRFTRPFCGDRGGMAIRVAGIDKDGAPVKSQWSLIAEKNDGPNVPTLAAVAAVRALLAESIAPGARPCVGVLQLPAIEQEMRKFAITTKHELY